MKSKIVNRVGFALGLGLLGLALTGCAEPVSGDVSAGDTSYASYQNCASVTANVGACNAVGTANASSASTYIGGYYGNYRQEAAKSYHAYLNTLSASDLADMTAQWDAIAANSKP